MAEVLNNAKFYITGVDSMNPPFVAELILTNSTDEYTIKAGYMPGKAYSIKDDNLASLFCSILEHMKLEETWEFEDFDEHGRPTLGFALIQSIIAGQWGDCMYYDKIIVSRCE